MHASPAHVSMRTLKAYPRFTLNLIRYDRFRGRVKRDGKSRQFYLKSVSCTICRGCHTRVSAPKAKASRSRVAKRSDPDFRQVAAAGTTGITDRAGPVRRSAVLLRLKSVEKGDGSLGVGGGPEDRSVVVL